MVSETSLSVDKLFPLFPCSSSTGLGNRSGFHYLPVLLCLSSLVCSIASTINASNQRPTKKYIWFLPSYLLRKMRGPVISLGGKTKFDAFDYM